MGNGVAVADRRFVPFDDLWHMRIDVPYSLLVRDGEHAWTCGQVALDADSNVVAADDLAGQSAVVAGYIAEVLGRADLDPEHLKRLLLYYVPVDDADGADTARVTAMQAAFRARLGHRVLLDPVPVPHFYYDGIVLEVDAFAGPIEAGPLEWTSVSTPVAELGSTLDAIDPAKLLVAHWFIPGAHIATIAPELERRGFVHDRWSVVSSGSHRDLVRGSLVGVTNGPLTSRTVNDGDVRVTSRRAAGIGWIAARSTVGGGLVEQTEQIMDAIARALATVGVDFGAVVKSTTLYVGGSSEEELHQNMAVRNRRYTRPGPASTGLPVFGLADETSLVTVDVTHVAG